ncbi:[Pyruvate dehydrogenase (acetyl-transferring)] kinase isozyme 2 [Kalmusia sp. IMI 367209]|nr:[Pyruvate dehydrogenase (acetyl-transferring)] kinase isozyme 2 [Kalmusia sp. IMI 367209]
MARPKRKCTAGAQEPGKCVKAPKPALKKAELSTGISPALYNANGSGGAVTNEPAVTESSAPEPVGGQALEEDDPITSLPSTKTADNIAHESGLKEQEHPIPQASSKEPSEKPSGKKSTKKSTKSSSNKPSRISKRVAEVPQAKMTTGGDKNTLGITAWKEPPVLPERRDKKDQDPTISGAMGDGLSRPVERNVRRRRHPVPKNCPTPYEKDTLLPWEQVAARVGYWEGLSHLLSEGQNLKGTAPEKLKPLRSCRAEWKACLLLYREQAKQQAKEQILEEKYGKKQGEAEEIAQTNMIYDFITRVNESNPSGHFPPSSKLEHLGLDREEDLTETHKSPLDVTSATKRSTSDNKTKEQAEAPAKAQKSSKPSKHSSSIPVELTQACPDPASRVSVTVTTRSCSKRKRYIFDELSGDKPAKAQKITEPTSSFSPEQKPQDRDTLASMEPQMIELSSPSSSKPNGDDGEMLFVEEAVKTQESTGATDSTSMKRKVQDVTNSVEEHHEAHTALQLTPSTKRKLGDIIDIAPSECVQKRIKFENPPSPHLKAQGKDRRVCYERAARIIEIDENYDDDDDTADPNSQEMEQAMYVERAAHVIEIATTTDRYDLTTRPQSSQITSCGTASIESTMPHNPQYLNTVLNSQSTTFTPTQRSQQARGKSYASSTAGEPYEARRKREQAAQILANLELLVWHSNARNESVAQTRQHFQNIMLGLSDEEVVWKEEYEVPLEQRVKRKDGGDAALEGSPAQSARSVKGKEKEMGKKRV